MGTNYYVVGHSCGEVCKYCHQPIEINDICYHLGKLSCGWRFIFQSLDDIKSFADWKDFIQKNGYKIKTEDGEYINLDYLTDLINNRQDGQSHINVDNKAYLSVDGYDFTDCTFY